VSSRQNPAFPRSLPATPSTARAERSRSDDEWAEAALLQTRHLSQFNNVNSHQLSEFILEDGSLPRSILNFDRDENQQKVGRLSEPSVNGAATQGREQRLQEEDSFTTGDRWNDRWPLDPSRIEFAPSADYYDKIHSLKGDGEEAALLSSTSYASFVNENGECQELYPLALMLHNSAPFIAAHSGKTAVFHIPGEYVVSKNQKLFSDIALAHLLGMKIVIVVGNRMSNDESCNLSEDNSSIECQNSLSVTSDQALRKLEEEAGFLRVEVERKLNRHLKLNGVVSTNTEDEGNVVSGSNFYTARHFRHSHVDLEHSGFTSAVHTSSIQHRLDNQDIVLLTTIGVSPLGDVVNVNGYHLAACVASALDAYKVIYLSNEGTVLKKAGSTSSTDPPAALIQEIPLSFAKRLTKYHDVVVHNSGYATFDDARERLEDPGAMELLLHLSWAAWALERGVTRAHIVNPGDGAILEELFTSKNGVNTCLYHDEEVLRRPALEDESEDDDEMFWNEDSHVASQRI
jgi:amino-acid N-acetyltransferase